jgi:hypothetical protein
MMIIIFNTLSIHLPTFAFLGIYLTKNRSKIEYAQWFSILPLSSFARIPAIAGAFRDVQELLKHSKRPLPQDGAFFDPFHHR